MEASPPLPLWYRRPANAWLMAGLVCLALAGYSWMGPRLAEGEEEPAKIAPVKAEAITANGAADLRVTAEKFVEHVNYARMAVAAKQAEKAREQIALAKEVAATLRSGSKGRKPQSGIQSGRVVYDGSNPDYKNHYFPIEAGPVKVKNVESGPFWSDRKGAAVTDAELVYITIDMGRAKNDKRLDRALALVEAKDFKGADTELARLAEEVVTVDSTLKLPLEKARDNLALARNFVMGRNYSGARYALGHARDALDSMEDSAQTEEQRNRILAMRTDVVLLQDKIARNDPTALEKAEQTIEGWWNELKSWSAPPPKKR